MPEVSLGCHGRAPQEARQRRPRLEPVLELCPIPALPVHPRLMYFLSLCNLLNLWISYFFVTLNAAWR